MHIQVAVVSGCHVVELAILGSVNLGDSGIVVCGDGNVIIGVVAGLVSGVSSGVHRSFLSLSSFP